MITGDLRSQIKEETQNDIIHKAKKSLLHKIAAQ